MLARTGNLHQAFAAFRDIESDMNRIVEHAKPTDAEISPVVPADWFLVQTFPGDDLRAMRWLARRRFGVFRPMQQRKAAHSEGQIIGNREAIFPGWLFIYCWDIDRMRGRILACPGVHSLFCFPGTMTPVPIAESFVQALRAKSLDYNERLGYVGQTANRNVARQQRTPKLGHKERKTIDKLKKALKHYGKFDPATWSRLATLAPAKRIALLMQALAGPVVEGGAQ